MNASELRGLATLLAACTLLGLTLWAICSIITAVLT